MSTQGIDSNNNIQQAPPHQDYSQQSRQVSERQASDFADRMAKEKAAKEKNQESKKPVEGDKQSIEDNRLLANTKKVVGKKNAKGDEDSLIDKNLAGSNKRPTNELEQLSGQRNTTPHQPEKLAGQQEKRTGQQNVATNETEKLAYQQTVKASDDKKPSLEELLAERSKPLKKKETNKEESVMLNARESSEHNVVTTLQSPVKVDTQIREIQQASTVKEVDAALQKLATQIQVSAKDALNGAEVRITLKDSVLPGTEIRIQRHAGELTITMNTTSAEAGNFLAAHEANLQRILAERFSNDKVQVNVNLSNGDNQDQEQDGRSRNQYANDDNEPDNEPDNA